MSIDNLRKYPFFFLEPGGAKWIPAPSGGFELPHCLGGVPEARVLFVRRHGFVNLDRSGDVVVRLVGTGELEQRLRPALLVLAVGCVRYDGQVGAFEFVEVHVGEQPKGSGDEEDAWFLATRLLADMYLNELQRPDLAIVAYTSYREYQKSGAETLFQLARAYEANNNIPAAIQIYEAVTAYEKHPRYYDATEAVRKLKGN